MKSKQYSGKLRLLRLFLPISLLALCTFGFFTYPFLNLVPPPLLDLSRAKWSACYSAAPGPDCRMEPISVPSDVTFLKDRRFKGWIYYSVEFETPRECLPPGGNCSLFISELGDSGRFTLNGRALPEHGRAPPKGRYARHYPVDLSLPAEFLKAEGNNLLTISAYSFKNVQAGIRKGPVGLFTSEEAFQLARTRLSQSIITPIASAALLFLIALMTLGYLVFTGERSASLKALIRFCVAMSFFLFSFTELPREFLPVTFAGFFHYALRFLSDLFFFELVRKVFFRSIPVWAGVRKVYWFFWCAYPTWYLLEYSRGTLLEKGFGDAYLITRIAAPLLLLPHLLGFWGSWKLERSGFRTLLLVVFSATILCQLNDLLVFHAYRAGQYFVRFYPVAIAFGMGLYLFREHNIQKIEEGLILKTDALRGSMALQVAHDIRSPLAALEMISGQLDGLSEEKRLIVRNAIARIRDIALSLKSKGRTEAKPFAGSLRPIGGPNGGEGVNGPDRLEELLVAPLLEELIMEKRLEYRDRCNLAIRFEPGRESYGLAATLDQREFKRMISNLVNNSVEACEPEGGGVEISLRPADSHGLEISVQDSGCGMSPALLARLGARGVTWNKSGGSGLGLAHAKETVESWGGTLRIESVEGEGTTVRILFPRKDPPAWFVPALQVRTGATVVVLDDDQSIHEVWRDRFDAGIPGRAGVTLAHLGTAEQFRSFFRERFFDLEDPVFLVDQEIRSDGGITGLDLVEEFGLCERAVLVTSLYEDSELRKRCERAGVRLIPKSMSGFVPIEFDA